MLMTVWLSYLRQGLVIIHQVSFGLLETLLQSRRFYALWNRVILFRVISVSNYTLILSKGLVLRMTLNKTLFELDFISKRSNGDSSGLKPSDVWSKVSIWQILQSSRSIKQVIISWTHYNCFSKWNKISQRTTLKESNNSGLIMKSWKQSIKLQIRTSWAKLLIFESQRILSK